MKQKNIEFQWTDIHQEALLKNLKNHLTSAPVLIHPNYNLPFELHVDAACTQGIGVVLTQKLDNVRNRSQLLMLADLYNHLKKITQ